MSALLLGGNVTVKKGKDVGGDFKHVRACRANRQIGCVVAFSTFKAQPPANSHLRPHQHRRPGGAVHEPRRPWRR